MNLRHGTPIVINESHWPDTVSADERTPQNAFWRPILLISRGPEWLPPNQHMVVRLASQRGELCLTQRELALNGAIEQ